MNITQVQIITAAAATLLYISNMLPMLSRTFLMRDLASYSLARIELTSVGNWVYWVYVVELPVGPVLLLHGFYTTAAGLMLVQYLCYEKGWGRRVRASAPPTPLTTGEILALAVACR